MKDHKMADSVWVSGEVNGNTLQRVKYHGTLGEAVAEIKASSSLQDENFKVVRIEDNLDGILVLASGGELSVDLAAGGTGGFGVQGE